MEEFNIWDLERVNIKVKPEFLAKINKEIGLKFKSKTSFLNVLSKEENLNFFFIKNILKPSYQKKLFFPLQDMLKICLKLDIKKEDLQNNVLAYKTAGGTNFIKNPILPIKITPVFDMLLAHHMGDGTVINPKKGRLPYFGYRQFDKFYRIQYIKKIENVFGDIIFKENYFETSTRPYCPPVISSLFFKYYNLEIKDFLSEESRIPQIIFNKTKDDMLAVLIAFIIDEGHIDSTQITIGLKNKALIQDLKKLCDILRYDSKVTYRKNEIYVNYGYLNILRKGMKKLWKDYLELNKNYQVINLGIKGEKIKNSFRIYNRHIYKTEGNREIIFEILKKEQLSVNQLAERINMTRQGVRFHIRKLLKEEKIRLINNKELNWIYRV